jgi:MoaA/NifB/PqqE/SkfB family radical SAM enzyme
MEKVAKNVFNFIKRKPAMLLTNILITELCTQRCLQCSIPSRKSSSKNMTFTDFSTILQKLSDYGTQFITISGGEPMLHPELEKFLLEASKYHFKNVHLLTTLYGSDELIDNVIDLLFTYNLSVSCSFDGFDEIADYLRGAKNVAETVIKNMKKIDMRNREADKKIVTGINVVISNKNLEQIPRILEFAEEMNWATNIDLYRWTSKNHNEHDEMKITDLIRLSEILDLAKKSDVVKTPDWLLDGFLDYYKHDFKKMCPYLDSPTFGSKFFIQVNGDLDVCIGSRVGNLLQSTPTEIFSGKEWKERLQHFKQCAGCWNSCYTLSSRASNYLNFGEINKVVKNWKSIKKV